MDPRGNSSFGMFINYRRKGGHTMTITHSGRIWKSARVHSVEEGHQMLHGAIKALRPPHDIAICLLWQAEEIIRRCEELRGYGYSDQRGDQIIEEEGVGSLDEVDGFFVEYDQPSSSGANGFIILFGEPTMGMRPPNHLLN